MRIKIGFFKIGFIIFGGICFLANPFFSKAKSQMELEMADKKTPFSTPEQAFAYLKTAKGMFATGGVGIAATDPKPQRLWICC